MKGYLRLLLLAGPIVVGCGHERETPPVPSAGSASPSTSAEAPAGSAILRGVVKLSGTAPPPEPWGGSADAECKGLHEATIQLVKVQEGKLADVFVYVGAGLPKGSHRAPAEPVALDQKECELAPRVFGIMVGQPLVVGNGDRIMHAVSSPEFDQAIPLGTKRTLKLVLPAVMAPIKCDAHPWSRAYAGVMEHPYFAVTKEDGTFEMRGLVDGEYTIEAWHEKLGRQEVQAKAPGTVEITFSVAKRR